MAVRSAGGGAGAAAAPVGAAALPLSDPDRGIRVKFFVQGKKCRRPDEFVPHGLTARQVLDRLGVAADAEAAPRPRRHQRYHPRLAHPPLDHLPSSRHRAASCCWRCGAACRSCTSLVVRSSVRSRSGRVMSSCVWVCPIAVISKMLDGSSSFRV